MYNKIKVFYKDIFLGELTMQGDVYVYNSAESEAEGVKKYILKISSYSSLIGSKNQKSKLLFKFFSEVVEQIKQRNDLITESQIVQGDSDFVILAKYAKLEQYKQNFHFTSEN